MIVYDREEMATICEIKKVIDHPNADRLDIVTINEWNCVAAKGTFQENDLCIYFEIDSILPIEVESAIFGADAKVKLKDARVRTIKLRGAISQGLAVPQYVVFGNGDINAAYKGYTLGTDVTKKLGIGKNVPTPPKSSVLNTGNGNGKKHASHNNPNFDRMRKPVHFKKVGPFDEPVMITEKIHGTSFVAGWIERPDKTVAEKINKFIFGDFQFCYRSMNVQLQGNDSLWNNILNKVGLGKKSKMENTLYGRMCIKYNLKSNLAYGHAISAEIYGSGIQANYDYGCAEGQHRIAGFGFRHNEKELCPFDVHSMLKASNVPTVPVLFVGDMPDDLTTYTEGPSVLDPKTKVREGCVVNTLSGEKGWHGAALIKNINPKYLLMSDNTEFN